MAEKGRKRRSGKTLWYVRRSRDWTTRQRACHQSMSESISGGTVGVVEEVTGAKTKGVARWGESGGVQLKASKASFRVLSSARCWKISRTGGPSITWAQKGHLGTIGV